METIRFEDGSGNLLCTASGGTWGDPVSEHDCDDCDFVWDTRVYYGAGVGPSCADVGHSDTVEYQRLMGYAAIWNGGAATDALVASSPDGTWSHLGTAIFASSPPVSYELKPGFPKWERP